MKEKLKLFVFHLYLWINNRPRLKRILLKLLKISFFRKLHVYCNRELSSRKKEPLSNGALDILKKLENK